MEPLLAQRLGVHVPEVAADVERVTGVGTDSIVSPMRTVQLGWTFGPDAFIGNEFTESHAG